MNTERLDQNRERQIIQEQTRLYEKAGLDVEAVEQMVSETTKLRAENYEANGANRIDVPESESHVFPERGFYIHPSDPLRLMKQELTGSPELSLKGKKVLTVAGSGETVPFFAMLDAGQVDAFDISPFACLMTEAKTAGYQNLPRRQDYSHMFLIGSPDVIERKINEYYQNRNQDEPWPAKWCDDSFFRNEELYSALQKHLTPQARHLLDKVKDPKLAKLLFQFDYTTTPNDINHFRNYEHDVYLEDILPALSDDREFSILKQKLRKIPTNIFLADLEKIPREKLQEYEYIFISNVGFNIKQQLKIIASLLLEKEVPRIGFCMGAAGSFIEQSEHKAIDINGQVVEIKKDDTSQAQNSPLLKINFGKPQELVPGTMIKLRGINIRIICHDISSPDLPIYAEVHAENNKELFNEIPDTVEIPAYKNKS